MSQVTPLPMDLGLPPSWRGHLDASEVGDAVDEIRLVWGWIVSGEMDLEALTGLPRVGSWANGLGPHAGRDLVTRLLTFRRQQLATAAGDLDRPRLDEAFAELRRRGVVALVDFFCCAYCLGSITGYEHPELDQVILPARGYLFLQEPHSAAPPPRRGVLVNCGVLVEGCDQPAGGSGIDPTAGPLIEELVAPILAAHGFILGSEGRHLVVRDAAWSRSEPSWRPRQDSNLRTTD